MTELIFRSKLSPYMIGLVEHKRALGYKYEEQVRIMKRFDALCAEKFPDECTVTKKNAGYLGDKSSNRIACHSSRKGDGCITFGTVYDDFRT